MTSPAPKLLVDQVVDRFADTPDPRLREIMTSLVSHLHQFVRDVKLTEPEFQSALAIVNRIGQLSSDTHNEASVMAGSLGVSPLVCLLNNGNNGATETTANLLGPFWRMHSPRVDNGGTLLRSPIVEFFVSTNVPTLPFSPMTVPGRK